MSGPPAPFEAQLLAIGRKAQQVGIAESLALAGIGWSAWGRWLRSTAKRLGEDCRDSELAFGLGLVLGIHVAARVDPTSAGKAARAVRPFIARGSLRREFRDRAEYVRTSVEPEVDAVLRELEQVVRSKDPLADYHRSRKWDPTRSRGYRYVDRYHPGACERLTDIIPGCTLGGSIELAHRLGILEPIARFGEDYAPKSDVELTPAEIVDSGRGRLFLSGIALGHQLRQNDPGRSVPVPEQPRAPQVWLLTCGYDAKQLFEDSVWIRWAVHFAARAAQGNGELPWWPMLSVVRPGDLVLISLAPFDVGEAEDIDRSVEADRDWDVVDEAGSYGLPTSPRLDRGSQGVVRAPKGAELSPRLFGAGLIREHPYWDKGEWRVPVTSIVGFPMELTTEEIEEALGDRLSEAMGCPLMENQFELERIWVSPRRWADFRTWLKRKFEKDRAAHRWLHYNLDRLEFCSSQLAAGVAPESIDAIAPVWEPSGLYWLKNERSEAEQSEKTQEEKKHRENEEGDEEPEKASLHAQFSVDGTVMPGVRAVTGDPADNRGLNAPYRVSWEPRAQDNDHHDESVGVLTWRSRPLDAAASWEAVMTDLDALDLSSLGVHPAHILRLLEKARAQLLREAQHGDIALTLLPLTLAEQFRRRFVRERLEENLGPVTLAGALPADPAWSVVRPVWCHRLHFGYGESMSWWLIGVGDHLPSIEIDGLCAPLAECDRDRRLALLGLGPPRELTDPHSDRFRRPRDVTTAATLLRAEIRSRLAAVGDLDLAQAAMSTFGDAVARVISRLGSAEVSDGVVANAISDLGSLARGVGFLIVNDPPWVIEEGRRNPFPTWMGSARA